MAITTNIFVYFQVYLVTGGLHQDDLDSTELLTEDDHAWVFSGVLPSARYGVKAATLDNKLIVTGESLAALISDKITFFEFSISGGNSDGDQILEWDQTSGQWKMLGTKLKQSRFFHGMSVIKMEDVNDDIDCTSTNTRNKRSAPSINAERSKWIQLFLKRKTE